MSEGYNDAFYAKQTGGSRHSAAVVVPMVMAMLRPRSVVDLGCGAGPWLAAFAAAGVADYLGLDGDYVPRERLLIPQERFRPADVSQPVRLDRRYDLAVSLEVAEHLPETAAATFVGSLTDAAPAVLFSAAIPHQPGTHHVNLQWQDWWRALFAARGYAAVDAVRPAVQGRPDVSYWYQQNTVLYLRPEVMAGNPALVPVPDGVSLDRVHPELYRQMMAAKLKASGEVKTLGQALGVLGKVPRLAARSIRKRLGGGAGSSTVRVRS